MLFNSLDFALFLPIVFLLYWFATKGNYKIQNILLLIASCFFYAFWDWRFLFLLAVSILLIYYPAKWMMAAGSIRKKRLWLWTGVVFYGFFCYLYRVLAFFIGIDRNPGLLTNYLQLLYSRRPVNVTGYCHWHLALFF